MLFLLAFCWLMLMNVSCIEIVNLLRSNSFFNYYDPRFASSVAVSSTFLAAGAPDWTPTFAFPNAGAVQLYRRSGARWALLHTLYSPDPFEPNERFGSSLALTEHTATRAELLVGAPGVGAGSVLFYDFFAPSSRFEGAQRVASGNLTEGDNLGVTVALAPPLAAAASQAHGARGSVCIFAKDSAKVWREWQYFRLEGLPINARFGSALAMTGKVLAVGAPDATAAGAVAVYRLDEAVQRFEFEAMVEPFDGALSDEFGTACAVVEVEGIVGNVGNAMEMLVVGAPKDDDGGPARGALYSFRRVNGTWIHVEKVLAPSGGDVDLFGRAVAADGRWMAAAAANADVDGVSNAGKAHVFALDTGGRWRDFAAFWAPQKSQNGAFGAALALQDGQLAVGEPGSAGDGTAHAFTIVCDGDGGIDGGTASCAPCAAPRYFVAAPVLACRTCGSGNIEYGEPGARRAGSTLPPLPRCLPCDGRREWAPCGECPCRTCLHVFVNATACLPCPEPLQRGSTDGCVQCPKGAIPNYANPGAECVKCPSGRFADPESGLCELCPNGKEPSRDQSRCEPSGGSGGGGEDDDGGEGSGYSAVGVLAVIGVVAAGVCLFAGTGCVVLCCFAAVVFVLLGTLAVVVLVIAVGSGGVVFGNRELFSIPKKEYDEIEMNEIF